jgi:hypothetical protein
VIIVDKSFYYVVPWSEANTLVKALSARFIPFVLEQSKRLNIPHNHIAIVFPDLHVRVYTVIRELFGRDGLRYPE